MPTIFEFTIRTAVSSLTLTLPSCPPRMRAASPTLAHCAVARTCARRLAHPAVTRSIPSRHLDHQAAVSLTSPSPLSHGRARRTRPRRAVTPRGVSLTAPRPPRHPAVARARACTETIVSVCICVLARSPPYTRVTCCLTHPRLYLQVCPCIGSLQTRRRRRHLRISPLRPRPSSLHTRRQPRRFVLVSPSPRRHLVHPPHATTTTMYENGERLRRRLVHPTLTLGTLHAT